MVRREARLSSACGGLAALDEMSARAQSRVCAPPSLASRAHAAHPLLSPVAQSLSKGSKLLNYINGRLRVTLQDS
jgi:hypothetical protein